MKRVVFSLTVILVLLLSVSALADTWMVDTPGGVYVRDPVTHEHIKTSDGKNAVMGYGRIVESYKTDNYWIYFYYNGAPAIIYKSYCKNPSGEEVQRAKENGGRVPINNQVASFVGVAKADLKVVKNPDKDPNTRLGTILAGETVYVLSTGKYWYKIVYQDKEVAYVDAKKVQLLDVNIPGEGTAFFTKGENDTGKFAIREAPSFDSAVTISLDFGTYVRVLKEVDSTWVLVAYNSNGDQGYMRRMWLRETTLFNPK